MGNPHAAPAAVDRQEKTWCVFDKLRLKLCGEHEVAIAFLNGDKRGEDATVDAEVNRTHVRTFNGALERKGNAAEIFRLHAGHEGSLALQAGLKALVSIGGAGNHVGNRTGAALADAF